MLKCSETVTVRFHGACLVATLYLIYAVDNNESCHFILHVCLHIFNTQPTSHTLTHNKMQPPTSTETRQASQDYTSATRWPVRRMATIFNICPQGECMVVERFGKLHKIHEPGFFFTVPLMDRIRFRVDMRERTLRYPPQLAITKDNVSVHISAVVFLQFIDVEKACYGALNPLVAIMELAKSAMRSVVGEMELDQLFNSRHLINSQVCDVLSEPADAWGVQFTRHEVLDVRTDDVISSAMDRQAAAERLRRERVLRAEGEREQMRLQSEGVRIRLENESEGNRIRVENEAKAHAESVRLTAEADAAALDAVAASLAKNYGQEAAQIAVARDYIKMYSLMGSKNNTIMMGEEAQGMNAFMAKAGVALGVAQQSLGGRFGRTGME